MSEETPAQKIARYETVLDAQADEIDRLRAENQRLIDWIMGDANAHTCLQAVYNNPNSSEANRVKAASAAIGYEQGKIRDGPPVLELRASVPLDELLRYRMARQDALEGVPRDDPRHLEWREPDWSVTSLLPVPGGMNGNGDSDGD
jgi:hypothetical protein